MNARTQHSILLIEDNPGDARLMQEYLSEPSFADFKLVHAASLQEGIRLLTAAATSGPKIDLVSSIRTIVRFVGTRSEHIRNYGLGNRPLRLDPVEGSTDERIRRLEAKWKALGKRSFPALSTN